jgi:Ca2+-binding RTX toxin-like protein
MGNIVIDNQQNHYTDATPGYTFAANGDTVTILAGVLVGSKQHDGVSGPSNYSGDTLINNGNILSGFGIGVGFYGDNAHIFNNASGQIVANFSGIGLGGDHQSLVNHGKVFGLGVSGVTTSNAGHLSVTNDGDIYGVQSGINLFFSPDGGTITNAGAGLIRSDNDGIYVHTHPGLTTIINNGASATIRGTDYSIHTVSDGGIRLTNDGKLIGGVLCAADNEVDTVINRGSIIGNVTLGSGVDSYTGAGTVSGFVLGQSHNDVLTGGAAADRLDGGTDQDMLTGYIGNDILRGGLGNDKLLGGQGRDTLTGGANVDFFIFNTSPNTATNRDILTDFSHADDTLQFENAVFTKLGGPGMLNAQFLRLGAAPLDANDYLIYNKATGVLTYDVNGNGAGGAQQVAVLTTMPTLALGDFVVI